MHIKDKNDDRTIRPNYVILQGAFEQLFAYFLTKGEITNFCGAIHTKGEATPLCKDISKLENNESIIHSRMRGNIKNALIVESRAKIINTLLKNNNTNFYCIYLNECKRGNSGERIKYENNLKDFKNLHDTPLNAKESCFPDSMNGATYIFKHREGEWYCLACKANKQIKTIQILSGKFGLDL